MRANAKVGWPWLWLHRCSLGGFGKILGHSPPQTPAPRLPRIQTGVAHTTRYLYQVKYVLHSGVDRFVDAQWITADTSDLTDLTTPESAPALRIAGQRRSTRPRKTRKAVNTTDIALTAAGPAPGANSTQRLAPLRRANAAVPSPAPDGGRRRLPDTRLRHPPER